MNFRDVKDFYGIKVRSVFISDVHLLTKRSQAEKLYNVLMQLVYEQVFILGDLLDLRDSRQYGMYVDEHIKNLIDMLLLNPQVPTKYIEGNHEKYNPRTPEEKRTQKRKPRSEHWHLLKMILDKGSIPIIKSFKYESVSGRKILLIHGDGFGSGSGAWKTKFGGWTYPYVGKVSRFLKRVTNGKFHLITWLLGREAYKKYRKGFIQRAIECAVGRDCDDIMCGHMHDPHFAEIAGHRYYNTGDWVDSCTLIVETVEGELIHVKLFD